MQDENRKQKHPDKKLYCPPKKTPPKEGGEGSENFEAEAAPKDGTGMVFYNSKHRKKKERPPRCDTNELKPCSGDNLGTNTSGGNSRPRGRNTRRGAGTGEGRQKKTPLANSRDDDAFEEIPSEQFSSQSEGPQRGTNRPNTSRKPPEENNRGNNFDYEECDTNYADPNYSENIPRGGGKRTGQRRRRKPLQSHPDGDPYFHSDPITHQNLETYPDNQGEKNFDKPFDASERGRFDSERSYDRSQRGKKYSDRGFNRSQRDNRDSEYSQRPKEKYSDRPNNRMQRGNQDMERLNNNTDRDAKKNEDSERFDDRTQKGNDKYRWGSEDIDRTDDRIQRRNKDWDRHDRSQRGNKDSERPYDRNQPRNMNSNRPNFKSQRGNKDWDNPSDCDSKMYANKYQRDNTDDRTRREHRNSDKTQGSFLEENRESGKSEADQHFEHNRNHGGQSSAFSRRNNSGSKDYSDTRLFNPYENDAKARERRAQNSVSGLSHQSHPAMHDDMDEPHIHGGLIHLPNPLDLNANSGSTDSSAAHVDHRRSNHSHFPNRGRGGGAGGYHGFKGGGYEAGGNKPVGFVRPSIPQDRSIGLIPMESVKPVYYPYYEDEYFQYSSKQTNPSNPLFAIISEIRQLDAELLAELSRPPFAPFSTWTESVNSLRRKLLTKYEQVILMDVDLCNKDNIEQSMWKSAFYTVIELFRKWMDQPSTTGLQVLTETDVDRLASEIKTCALELVSEGASFLEDCLQSMQTTFKMDLEGVTTAGGHLPPDTGSRTKKLVYLSAQKLMLFLGDLARYRELFSGSDNFGEARKWYLKSHMLAPKNGRPYNQLAVLAVYTQRRLDAMYYYMRTLAASNPFLTATQNLSSLFEEVRRKAEDLIHQRQESLKRRRQQRQSAHLYRDNGGGSFGARLEIWVNPSDGSLLKEVVEGDSGEKEDYVNMPFIELNKRFTLSFLHAHGMLFTKIGMEHFPEVCSAVLLELESLLNQTPCPFSSVRLCQLLIVNMFNMGRSASLHRERQIVNPAELMLGGAARSGQQHTLRSLHQEQACRMGLDMFALICHRCTSLMKQSDHRLPLPDEVRRLLPCLRLWTDWMVIHPEHWNPPPCQRDPLLGPHLDDWSLVAELCTEAAVCLRECRREGEEMPAFTTQRPKTVIASTRLDEEEIVAGFTPMLDQTPQVIYYDNPDDLTKIEDFLRLEKLQLFGDYLSGIQPQILDYSVSDHRYTSLVHREQSERQADNLLLPSNQSASAEALRRQSSGEASDPTSPTGLQGWPEEDTGATGGEIAELRERRAALQREAAQNRRMEEQQQLVLESAGGQRQLQLEVAPVFIIPDTNCYIDFLAGIKGLITSKKYRVIVPIVVVNELEYIAKHDETELENSQVVEERAAAALAFLEEQFERRPGPHLRAITGKGSLLETIAFRNEEIERDGRNNDDVILACCMHFCQDKARDFMPRNKDQPIRLHREVVLLTSDRNLRLKALTSNVPVRPLSVFLRWAKIPPVNTSASWTT